MNAPISISALPNIGAAFEGGTFAGLTTLPYGTHCAVILLPDLGDLLAWGAANSLAQECGGDLPSRAIATLLFANVKNLLRPKWHRTCEPDDRQSHWLCHFSDGFQNDNSKRHRAAAVAVRCIPLIQETRHA